MNGCDLFYTAYEGEDKFENTERRVQTVPRPHPIMYTKKRLCSYARTIRYGYIFLILKLYGFYVIAHSNEFTNMYTSYVLYTYI